MMDIIFFDLHGTPIAYSNNGKDIFLFTGECAAYLHLDSIYSYNGIHLGWYEDGWILDNHGYCVFFTKDSQGGPMIPMKKMIPMKSIKQMKPMKGMKEMKPMKPMKSLNWSDKSGSSFFD